MREVSLEASYVGQILKHVHVHCISGVANDVRGSPHTSQITHLLLHPSFTLDTRRLVPGLSIVYYINHFCLHFLLQLAFEISTSQLHLREMATRFFINVGDLCAASAYMYMCMYYSIILLCGHDRFFFWVCVVNMIVDHACDSWCNRSSIIIKGAKL